MDSKKQGKTNKRKGSNAEREYAAKFREIGYDACITARLGSRLHDNCGVDLINLPFSVQVKAGYGRGLNYSQVLFYTKSMLLQHIPQDADKPVICIHKKPKKKGVTPENEFNELVVMSFNDFQKLIAK